MLGAVLLVTLRIVQGLGAGAEQAGATTLISEVAPPKRRGYFASLPFVGIQLGTLLGAGTFALIGMANKGVLEGWLWRVPFLASIILIVVAIFIRLKLKETPVFQELEKHKNVVKNPVGELWKHSKKNVLVGIGLRMGENGNSSIYSALLISFMSVKEGVFPGDKFIGPVGLLIAAGFAAVMVVTFGALSDRIGRVKVYRYGALFQAIFAIPAFYLVTLGNVTLVWAVMVVGIALGVQSMLGPQCPLLPELFGSQYRFTGVALSRELSAVLAGGLVPLVGVALLAATGNSWVVLAVYSLVLALISYITTFFTPETAGRDLLSLEDAK
ncbi:putative inner membrane metabolite transport protein YdfJ [Arthrobacter sp. Hiyo8]|nr:putative inner membrane metabolite transport protein YdfJ [Arthrobacter sp. Hiyo8]